MKMRMRPMFYAVLLLTVSGPPLLGSGDTPAPEFRNPYIELGSSFHFVDSGDPLSDWNPLRTWTATDGRTMRARLEGVADDSGTFLLPGNHTVEIPLSRLSEKDRRFIAEWRELSRFFNLAYEESRDVTDTVQAGLGDGAFAREGTTHETRNFRFECDEPLNAAVVRDFSQLFEATLAMVRELPLGLEVARPQDGKFLVRLFAEKEDYHAAGGPVSAAGVYLVRSREILVPLASLGVRRSGGTFRKASEYDPSTLIHETVHAVTHQWIRYMPMWVVEGLAEYVASIPYRDGTFFLDRHNEGLHRMVAVNFGGDAHRFPLLAPDDFVSLSKNQFMERSRTPEQAIELTAIEPFQIRLIDEDEPVPSRSRSTAGGPEPPDTPAASIVRSLPPNPGPVIVQRYSSSMLLLDELLRRGQAANLRKYLFAHLLFEWDCEKYIDDYNRTLGEYQVAVSRQIADFESVLDEFNGAVRAYNEAINRKNEGADVILPEVPRKPEVPQAIPVPDILASPRQRDRFSRSLFRESAAEKFLVLPETLTLGGAR